MFSIGHNRFGSEAAPPVRDPFRSEDLPAPAEAPAREVSILLFQLQADLLRRLARIQASESRVAKLVRLGDRRSGRRAVRQIERERQRLARELHTGVGQLLVAIRIQRELIGEQMPNPPAMVGQALQRIGILAADALAQVHSVSQRLHPPEWQRLTLDAALSQLWNISGVAQRFAGSVRLDRPAREPGPDVKTLLYRAAQEALSNVMRHSRANRIDLKLEDRVGHLVLTIEDNGIGFDTKGLLTGPAEIGSGIGLRSIRVHACALGGKLLIHSGPLGTTLEVSVPQ